MADGESRTAAQGSSPTRAIGRGLAAILSEGREAADGLREVPVELVRPNPRQPRRRVGGEALLALAESIRSRGILQPIVVTPVAGGAYELVAGERRLRAAAIAGLERVPAIVRDAGDADRLELALVENMAREDLNPIDEARACATLVEDLGLTKEELGRRVGRSRVAVSNLIRLLELPDDVLTMIESGELSEGHGRALLLCRDHAARLPLAQEARARGWSVRETERRARAADGHPRGRRFARAAPTDPDLAAAVGAAEDALSAALGREVHVRPRGGSFRVELDLDDLREGVEIAERILRRTAA